MKEEFYYVDNLIILFPKPSVQYFTVQYSKVQYSTVQYSTVQYSTIQYSTIVCALCNRMIQKALMSPCTVNLSEPDFLNLNCGFPTTPRRALVYCVYATHIRVENNTIYVYRVSLSHTLT